MKFSIPVFTYSFYVNVQVYRKQKKLNAAHEAISKKLGFDDELTFEAAATSYYPYLNKDGFRCADIIFHKDKISVGTIAHEALHAALRICEYCDIQLSDESEETFSCLVGYITQSIYQEVKEFLK